MKSTLFLAVCFFLTLISVDRVYCQTPQKINYQAVARDAESGVELSNQAVFLVAKIIQSSSGGELVYQEEHANISTNSYGLFSTEIGNGAPVVGSFDEINWSTDQFWLEIDIDLGDGLQTMGSMQFVSVPYALHAETVSNPEDADSDPTNELIQDFQFNSSENQLTLTEGDQELTVNLQSLVEDADADPTNEAINNFSLDGDFLILNEQQDWAVNLGQFYEDDDADTTNELIDANGLSLSANGILTISEGGNANSVDLSPLIDDADSDPTNEAIPDNGLNLLNDTILQITEGSTLHELNLASLRDDEDWKKSESEEYVYNNDQKIGLGTSTPTSTLDVKGSLGVNFTILDNENTNSYSVTEEDYLIVFKLSVIGADPYQITLPNAADCPGRVIEFVRKGPTGIDIEVFFSGSNLDFQEPAIPSDFGGSFDGATKYVSLGTEGWIRIDI